MLTFHKGLLPPGVILDQTGGRLDDWLKVVARKGGIIVDPWILEWAGVVVMKKAYRI